MIKSTIEAKEASFGKETVLLTRTTPLPETRPHFMRVPPQSTPMKTFSFMAFQE
jgi:hypothetical protein